MSKKTIINEIVALYDENTALKAKIKDFTRGIWEAKSAEPTGEEKLNDLSRTLLFQSIFSKYDTPKVKVDEDSPEINFLTFEQWKKEIKRKVFENDYSFSDTRKITNEMALKDIIKYFDKELHEYYKNEVNSKKMELVREAKEKTHE